MSKPSYDDHLRARDETAKRIREARPEERAALGVKTSDDVDKVAAEVARDADKKRKK